MTTSADRPRLVVVDTNVLLSATDRSRDAHVAAIRLLEEDRRSLAVTPQIVREYLAVATRPLDANGFGLGPREAVANIEEFLSDLDLLAEDATANRCLRDLVRERGVAGKQVHDANVVAVAVAHHAAAVVTDNPRHFRRFEDLVGIEELHRATE